VSKQSYENYLKTLIGADVHPNDVGLSVTDRVEKEHLRRYLSRSHLHYVPPPYGHSPRRWLLPLAAERIEAEKKASK
jgi:hypothetical protein